LVVQLFCSSLAFSRPCKLVTPAGVLCGSKAVVTFAVFYKSRVSPQKK